MDNASAIITAKNLSCGYKNKVVWEDADFSINKGEFIAIIGPNGAGKTTLFRLMLGLIKPLKGELFLFGGSPTAGNKNIGYVPQYHPIDKDTNIEALELVGLGLNGNKWGFGSTKEDEEKIKEALKTVGAENLEHHSLSTLSGGELQRIFLAEALVDQAELLLLDEPLTSLDIKYSLNLIQLINDIAHLRKVTVLLIDHNINPLLPFLDKVMYIVNGRVTIGKPEEIISSETLTELYDMPIEVVKDSKGRLTIIGVEEQTHHE